MNERLGATHVRIRRTFALLPYVAIVLGVVALVWVGVRNLHSQDGFITLVAVVAIFSLVTRQAFTIGGEHRLQAKNKSLASWDRFARLLQHGSDVIALIDSTGVIRYATPSSERVLGIASDALVGRAVESIVDPGLVHEPLVAALARPLDLPGEPFEIPFTLPDGTVKEIELVATRTLDDEGEPTLVVNIRDVTERHAATEAMRLSRAHERAVLDAIPDQIYRFDRAGRFLGTANTPGPGTPFTEAAIGKTFAEILPETMARPSQEALDRAFAEGGIHEVSYSNDRPDGLHYFETRVVPVGDQEGLAIVRDVTSTRQATVALQRMAQILDATPDVVCSFAMNQRITYANAAFRTLFGLPDEGALELADKVLFPFPEVGRIFREIAIPEAVQNGFWRGDVEFQGDGLDAPVSMMVVAHGSRGETPEYISVIGRDIRQRRETERRLVEAKDAADSASKTKGEFLATMSHEIRTPMNGIIGTVELLLGTELSAEQRDFAATLRDSSEALLGIINDVLDFSKIEANSMVLERVKLELGPTIDSVCRVLGGAAAQKGLQLLVSIDPDVPTSVEGDPGRLRQVLINLVGNAVKFTEQGEVTVRVMRTGVSADGRTRLYFEVRDTGIGIASDVQARLFQSFAQADGSMSRRFGGTGLGLAISRRLVELMRGDLGVHSRLGDGSTFWFTAEFEPDPAARDSDNDRPLAGHRVLVLDDKPASRAILLEKLASWGTRAFAEQTEMGARRAMRAARDSGDPYRCLVVEDRVAGLSGEEMASRFAVADLAGTRVVLRCANGWTAVRSGTLSGAASQSWPVGSRALLDCLVHVLTPIKPAVAGEPEVELPAADVPAPRSDARVLLVEDNEVNRKVECAILARLGYEPDTAVDGLAAVRAASQKRYDTILMDCQMPGMDGFEATQKIRELEAGSGRVPIVALTANATGTDRARCLAAGMDDYLPKPVRIEAMRSMLARWVSAAPNLGIATSAETTVAPGSVQPPEPPHQTETPLLDVDAMAAIRSLSIDDEADMLGPLVDLFLEQAVGQMAQIHAAAREGDAANLESVAHTMKGASRSVGAARVGDLAEALERRGRAGSAKEAQLTAQLEAVLDATRSAFLAERLAHIRSHLDPAGGGASTRSDAVGEAA